jgi:chorismate synthase
MPGSSFGAAICLTTFGESHGPALGAVIDGMPAGLTVVEQDLRLALAARRPGRLAGSSSRDEADDPELLSGVFEGKTLGTPICVIVRNTDARSADYDALRRVERPGHADRTTLLKHGRRDHRGGGRASGRETLARVIGGYFAGLLLPPSCRVEVWIERLGPFTSNSDEPSGIYHLRGVDDAAVEAYLIDLKKRGESVGAQIACRVLAPPPGLGEPVFHKLKADLAAAIMSIGAVTAFGYGLGVEFGAKMGSDITEDNRSFGGMEGGISNGQTIALRCTVRPPSTVGERARQGRHDPCIAPRIVPVVAAMTKLVLADHLLRQTAIDAFQPR